MGSQSHITLWRSENTRKMVDLKRTQLKVRAERAALAQVEDPRDSNGRFDSLEELNRLARTAGAKVVTRLKQKRNNPDPHSYLGSGKVTELKRLCKTRDVDVVICDDDLSPAQFKNLENDLDTKVIDRTELILDIFATHARTRQAKLQVELAQLEYAYPRLKRMWTHLDRKAGGTVGGADGGGGIGVRGPGEKQLEVDRQLVQKSIHKLKKKLEEIEKRRQLQVEDRNERFPSVSLVGYTNAGKSSLLNALTHGDVSVKDQLFETLDTRTRRWELPDSREVMLSDTVGFIRKLPHHLVACFHATLEEAREADLMLHVIDASSDDVKGDIKAVKEVLDDIGCGDIPVLPVLNKIDLVDSQELIPLERELPDHVAVSAETGEGLDDLTARIQDFLDDLHAEVFVEAGVGNGKLYSFLHEAGAVLNTNYNGNQVTFHVKVPEHLTGVIESMGGAVSPAGGDGQA